MNVDNMLKLADFLDNLPEKKFAMNHWVGYRDSSDPTNIIMIRDMRRVGECGTTACIAGWAAALAVPNKDDRFRNFNPEFTARDWLDLNKDESEWLFMGEWGQRNDKSAIGQGTTKDAAAIIRKMVKAKDIPTVHELAD